MEIDMFLSAILCVYIFDILFIYYFCIYIIAIPFFFWYYWFVAGALCSGRLPEKYR